MPHLLRPAPGPGTLHEVTPQSAGWDYLGFVVTALPAGDRTALDSAGTEIAFVPLSGRVANTVDGERFELARESVFTELPHVLYVPPGRRVEIEALADAELAYGSAPAEGRYPLRLFAPSEMKCEVRGGGVARRQVNHVLAHPLPAERLILFEVYVPGGAWSGWPPHCHDGKFGSPYLEETYYYRVTPDAGFGVHRNYARDTDFDETFAVSNGDLVLVTEGFHPVTASPGCNLYFLNYLAGELEDDARATPPFDDPDHGWIKDDRWEEGRWPLPVPLDGA
jgi:5-deoxy-glucuronate isomerase